MRHTGRQVQMRALSRGRTYFTDALTDTATVWGNDSAYNMPSPTQVHRILAADISAPARPFTRGNKRYEMVNHLGNVLATVSDKRTLTSDGIDTTEVVRYFAEVMTAQDYYPFGSTMPGRTYDADTAGYRYGFNGKEADPENGNQYDYGFRIYNPQVARFLSVDPLMAQYPGWGPYSFAMNSCISGADIDGKEFYYSASGEFLRRGPNIDDQTVFVETMETRLVPCGQVGQCRQISSDRLNSTSWRNTQNEMVLVDFPIQERLSIDHTALMNLSWAIENESSVWKNAEQPTIVEREEMYAHAECMNNHAFYAHISLTAVANIPSSDYMSLPKGGAQFFEGTGVHSASSTRGRNAIASAIYAARESGGTSVLIQYSNGAEYWDGGDILDYSARWGQGMSHTNVKGRLVHQDHADAFNLYWKGTTKTKNDGSEQHRADMLRGTSTTTRGQESKNVINGTIFWGPTSQ